MVFNATVNNILVEHNKNNQYCKNLNNTLVYITADWLEKKV